MKIFLHFALALFFTLGTLAYFYWVDPSMTFGVDWLNWTTNLTASTNGVAETVHVNIYTVLAGAVLIGISIGTIYLFIISFFDTPMHFHYLRAIGMGVFLGVLFSLRSLGLLSLVVFIICLLIYILSELVIFESKKR